MTSNIFSYFNSQDQQNPIESSTCRGTFVDFELAQALPVDQPAPLQSSSCHFQSPNRMARSSECQPSIQTWKPSQQEDFWRHVIQVFPMMHLDNCGEMLLSFAGFDGWRSMKSARLQFYSSLIVLKIFCTNIRCVAQYPSAE